MCPIGLAKKFSFIIQMVVGGLVYEYGEGYTVEPLIMDTLNKGHNRKNSLYKGHTLGSLLYNTSTF